VCPEIELAGLGFHHIVECTLAGAPSILCTSGYTGEPGYEMLLPAENCEALWSAMLAAGVSNRLIPCGLAARDSLRAEACLPLYGNEIDETTDPLSAGLARAAVSLEGHEFIGRRALAALALEKPGQVIIGFEMVEPGVPRHGYPISADGRTVGRVTTGLFSPSTGKYLGMGYVEVPRAGIGERVGIIIREAVKAARIIKRPFYTSPHWR
jgi:aminomethyltransferase